MLWLELCQVKGGYLGLYRFDLDHSFLICLLQVFQLYGSAILNNNDFFLCVHKIWILFDALDVNTSQFLKVESLEVGEGGT